MKLYYTTFPDDTTRTRISRKMVEDNLAACVVATQVSSIYHWDGDVEEGEEVAALFKTTAAKTNAFLERLESEHPYEVPCILEIPVAANKAYDRWLQTVTDSILDVSTSDETVLVTFDIGPVFRVDTTLPVHELIETVSKEPISGELQDIFEQIRRLHNEYGSDPRARPVVINGEATSTTATLAAFADNEPVDIRLR